MRIKLIALLIFLSIRSFSQGIPKGSDKIIVKNNALASENFLKVKQFLADKDILIALQDKDINQIKTGKIKYSSYVNYSLLINCKDNQISFTGTWTNNVGLNISGITIGPSDYLINYKGSSKSVFEKMDALCKEFSSNIIYEGGINKKDSKQAKDDVYR